MPKKTQSIKKILEDGRDRFDNELIEIEKVWAKLKVTDYDRRKKLVKVVMSMLEIDQSLKMWENKFHE